MILGAILMFMAPSALASSSSWCSPEYSTCSDEPKGGTDSVSSGGNLRDGTRVFGSHYVQCSANYPTRCLECHRDPVTYAPKCGLVNHDAHCECTETVRNYITTDCGTYGWCSYHY
jgi:hypothetical protein